MEARVVEQRVGVGDQEGEQGADAGEQQTADDARSGARIGRPVARATAAASRDSDDDSGGVLAGARQAQTDAGDQVVARAPFAQDARTAEQRERERRERGHVVERQVRVEDGQEGDRLDGGGEQADATPEQPRAGGIQQPQGTDAEQGGGYARERVDVGGVLLEGAQDPLSPAVPRVEQVVQQIGEGGRVCEVVRVEAAVLEHRDGARDEVVALVGVVDVGQPLLYAPQAQREAAAEHQREPGQAQRRERRCATPVAGAGAAIAQQLPYTA